MYIWVDNWMIKIISTANILTFSAPKLQQIPGQLTSRVEGTASAHEEHRPLIAVAGSLVAMFWR